MLRRGDLFAGRFEVEEDQAAVLQARLWARKAFWGAVPVRVEDLWLRGVDRQTGARVWIHPRGIAFQWTEDLHVEAAARCVARLGLATAVPVLHVGPGVVFAAPPAVTSCATPSRAEAAACAVDACEVVAHLHAAGLAGDACLGFGPTHLRLVHEGGRPCCGSSRRSRTSQRTGSGSCGCSVQRRANPPRREQRVVEMRTHGPGGGVHPGAKACAGITWRKPSPFGECAFCHHDPTAGIGATDSCPDQEERIDAGPWAPHGRPGTCCWLRC